MSNTLSVRHICPCNRFPRNRWPNGDVEVWVAVNPDHHNCLAVRYIWGCECAARNWQNNPHRSYRKGLVMVRLVGNVPEMISQHPLNDPRD